MGNEEIEKKAFCVILDAMQKMVEQDLELCEGLAKLYPNASSADFITRSSENLPEFVKGLSVMMQDEVPAPHLEHSWIEYYVYELDFGKENHILKAYDENKKEIPLSNSSELYEHLYNQRNIKSKK